MQIIRTNLKSRIVEAIQCKELLCLIARKINDLPDEFKLFCNRFQWYPFSKSYEDVVNAFKTLLLRAPSTKRQKTSKD